MKAASGDQRAFRRYPVNMAVLVRRVPDETGRSDWAVVRRSPTASGLVTNLSLSGVVFVSPRPYAPGSLVEIQFSLGASIYPVRAVVKRGQVQWLPGRRAFECAAQFVRTESVTGFIPTVAKYLHRRYSDPAAYQKI